jgi:hypothetical protein
MPKPNENEAPLNPNSEEELDGIKDPFLDSLLSDPPTTDDTSDENSDLDEGAAPKLVEPRDLEIEDPDGNQLDIAIELIADDTATTHERDDATGPLGIETLNFPESENESFTDGAEEGPVEAPILLSDPSPLTEQQTEKDGEDYGDDPIGIYVDDADLPWAKERWTERALGETFTARSHLALVGNTLCVAGDETHLHDARTFALLEKLPITQKTLRILSLDVECKSLVLLTAAGRLLAYFRTQPGKTPCAPTILTQEMVTDLWQQGPGVPSVLVRLENGQLLDLTLDGLSQREPHHRSTQQRLLAMSDIGEPRVTLHRSSRGLELQTDAAGETRTYRLSPSMQRAASEHRSISLGFNEAILFGARNYGLWLCPSKHHDFQPVPGCRSLTALAVGRLGSRPTAFVGLFSELEDRAEIATIDLTTGRASKIAELCIHSDCTGPEDDPPELARIDAMVWDPTQGSLWVAGSFGLTCFTVPANTTSS